MTLGGVFTRLRSFTAGADGLKPWLPSCKALDGNFYGTTKNGGPANRGTVFRMTPAGVTTILHAFTGGADGFEPLAALVSAPDGTLYGTVSLGGSPGAGGVFTIAMGGTFSMLHTFVGSPEGVVPQAGVIQGNDGNFYGTTSGGGESGAGTVFKMTPAGVITVLHAFNYTDGSGPFGALLQGDGRQVLRDDQSRRRVRPRHGLLDDVSRRLHRPAFVQRHGRFGSALRADSGNRRKLLRHDTVGRLREFRHRVQDHRRGRVHAAPLVHRRPTAPICSPASCRRTTDSCMGRRPLAARPASERRSRWPPTARRRCCTRLPAARDGAMPRAALIQGMDGNFYGTTQAGGSSGPRDGVQDDARRRRRCSALVHRRRGWIVSDRGAPPDGGHLLRDDAARHHLQPRHAVQDGGRRHVLHAAHLHRRQRLVLERRADPHGRPDLLRHDLRRRRHRKRERRFDSATAVRPATSTATASAT